MAQIELRNTSWEWWIRPKISVFGNRLWLGGIDDSGQVRLDVIASDGTTNRVVLDNLSGNDDHNSCALLTVTGQVPIAFWCRHNQETFLRYKRGSAAAESSFVPTFGALQQLSMGAGTTATYAHAFANSGVIHLWTRVSTGVSQSRYYYYARSSDWGATWDIAPEAALDAGFADAYLYPAMAQVGTTLRIGVTESPESARNDVRYCEVDLTTGAVTSGGSTVGNLWTPTGLPVALSSLEVVRDVPVGIHSNFFDTGANSVPEVTWVEFDSADTQGTGMYYYAVKRAGTWTVNQVCPSGQEFGQDATGGYMGGVHCTDVTGALILSRRSAGGTWTVERWTTVNDGASWTSSVIASSTSPLVRPFHIPGHPTWKSAYVRIDGYGTGLGDLAGYSNWTGSLIVSDQ